ncbi:MAG: hypothetical protein HQM13_09115 [SAR324 cluster bacterium]|nr:hypothetical protein [SAR324 cluster bacterium]
MKVNIILSGFLIFVMLSFNAYGKSPQNNDYKANALDAITGELRYTEEYREGWNKGRLQNATVIYRIPSGKVVAQKDLAFDSEFVQPSFRFEDLRDGYLKGVQVSKSKYRVFYRLKGKESIKEEILEIPSPVVLDAGIHYFILQHWNMLIAGHDLIINFVVPKQLDYYKLRISKREINAVSQQSVVQFEIKPDNFLLGLAAGVVGNGSNVMIYDLRTQKIVGYQGVSAIHDKQGKSFAVNVDYQYLQ